MFYFSFCSAFVRGWKWKKWKVVLECLLLIHSLRGDGMETCFTRKKVVHSAESVVRSKERENLRRVYKLSVLSCTRNLSLRMDFERRKATSPGGSRLFKSNNRQNKSFNGDMKGCRRRRVMAWQEWEFIVCNYLCTHNGASLPANFLSRKLNFAMIQSGAFVNSQVY